MVSISFISDIQFGFDLYIYTEKCLFNYEIFDCGSKRIFRRKF